MTAARTETARTAPARAATAATVGVIGVGRMGSRIAERLARARLLSAVCDKDARRAEDVHERHPEVTVTATARELAELPEVGVVITSLTDPMAVRLVHEGVDGLLAGLSAGMTVVEMSTIGPAQAAGLADQVEAAGARLLAAPLSGSPSAVAAGEALVMTSGPNRALTGARPALEAIGRLGPHLGSDPGAAMVMKLAVNAALYVLHAGLVEAVEVAERAGIPRAVTVRILAASALSSPALLHRRAALAGDPAATMFPLRDGVDKDLGLALALARQVGAPMPQTSEVAELVEAAIRDGHGDQDLAVGLVGYLRGRPAEAAAAEETMASIG